MRFRSEHRLRQLRHLASRLAALESGTSWYIETGEEYPSRKFMDEAFQKRRRAALVKVTATVNQEQALRQLDEQAVRCSGARLAWDLLCRDAKERNVRVSLALDKHAKQCFRANYRTRDGKPLPVTAHFGMDGKMELRRGDERVPAMFPTQSEKVQEVWLERVFGNGRHLLRENLGLQRPFTLPLDWTGEVEVRGLVDGDDGGVLWASDAGKPPAFHGVYARRGWGGFGHVADFDREADARCFAQCLKAMHGAGISAEDLWDAPEGAPPRENWGEAWGQADYEAARDEGWGVGIRDGAVAIVPLPSPAAAVRVEEKAAEGRPLHLKAMLFVLSHAMHDQFGSRLLEASARSAQDIVCAAPVPPEAPRKAFEITLAGFNGGTDATDDRVVWVLAPSEAVVREALGDTDCCVEAMTGFASEGDADFVLPAQAEALKAHVATLTLSHEGMDDAPEGLRP